LEVNTQRYVGQFTAGLHNARQPNAGVHYAGQ
jgi:hypothetical protein